MSWVVPSKIIMSLISSLISSSLTLFLVVSQNAETKLILSDNCHVLIATPGRLLDHFRTLPELTNRLKSLQTVVFDEADRLLDQGFKKDLNAIMGFLPEKKSRQSLLFSATISQDIKKVRRIILRGGTGRRLIFYSYIGRRPGTEVRLYLYLDAS
jgi:superfamily II DNA/RNA helicase